ncbi:MAG: hypothetical protein ACQESG_07800 [Nanobdellota archaeon]
MFSRIRRGRKPISREELPGSVEKLIELYEGIYDNPQNWGQFRLMSLYQDGALGYRFEGSMTYKHETYVQHHLMCDVEASEHWVSRQDLVVKGPGKGVTLSRNFYRLSPEEVVELDDVVRPKLSDVVLEQCSAVSEKINGAPNDYYMAVYSQTPGRHRMLVTVNEKGYAPDPKRASIFRF